MDTPSLHATQSPPVAADSGESFLTVNDQGVATDPNPPSTSGTIREISTPLLKGPEDTLHDTAGNNITYHARMVMGGMSLSDPVLSTGSPMITDVAEHRGSQLPSSSPETGFAAQPAGGAARPENLVANLARRSSDATTVSEPGNDTQPSRENGKWVHKHACKYAGCGKTFTTSAHLSRHTKLHMGIKPHHCPLPDCGKGFARRDNMMVHYRAHARKLGLMVDSRGNAVPDTRASPTPYYRPPVAHRGSTASANGDEPYMRYHHHPPPYPPAAYDYYERPYGYPPYHAEYRYGPYRVYEYPPPPPEHIKGHLPVAGSATQVYGGGHYIYHRPPSAAGERRGSASSTSAVPAAAAAADGDTPSTSASTVPRMVEVPSDRHPYQVLPIGATSGPPTIIPFVREAGYYHRYEYPYYEKGQGPQKHQEELALEKAPELAVEAKAGTA